MTDKTRERKMMIVREAGCWDGYGKEEGCTIFNLVMVSMADSDAGKETDRRYVFKEELPDYLRRDLLVMGYNTPSVQELRGILDDMVGIVVRVSLVSDGDTHKAYIEDYFGRDDPQKYKKTRG